MTDHALREETGELTSHFFLLTLSLNTESSFLIRRVYTLSQTTILILDCCFKIRLIG